MTEVPADDGALVVLNDGTVEQGIAALVDAIAGAAVLRAEVCQGGVDSGVVCQLPGSNPVASRLLGAEGQVTLSIGSRSVAATLREAEEGLDPDQCMLSDKACAALGAGAGDIVAIERLT